MMHVKPAPVCVPLHTETFSFSWAEVGSGRSAATLLFLVFLGLMAGISQRFSTMNRHAAAASVRSVQPSVGPIGFAVRDVTGRGRAFAIDEAAGAALVFGSASPIRVSAHGVMLAHFVVLPHDGVLVAASASAATPALLNGSPLPTTWTVLEVPSNIRLGAAAVDFFFVYPAPSVLEASMGTVVDLDARALGDRRRAPPLHDRAFGRAAECGGGGRRGSCERCAVNGGSGVSSARAPFAEGYPRRAGLQEAAPGADKRRLTK